MSAQMQSALQMPQKSSLEGATRSNVLQRAAISPTVMPVHSGVLQRCSNGVECADCREKRLERESLQRAAVDASAVNTVPSIVHDVLNSSGQPLDAGTRGFMEPRFGHDFSGVRVHTDARAAESARSVNALAYTVGRNMVFGTGQYAPGTGEGRRLLAHELTHVVQQSENMSIIQGKLEVSDPGDRAEQEANAVSTSVMDNKSRPDIHTISTHHGQMISRRVASRLVHCHANNDNAPDDPVAALSHVDQLAQDHANQIAEALADDAAIVAVAMPDTPSTTFASYQTNFGLPPAVGGGFLNRLTGTVRPSQNVVISDELKILSRRFALVGRVFSQFLNYLCPAGAHALSFGGCEVTCDGSGDAFSCRGIDAVFICSSFWDFSDEQQASVLIHEGFHIVFGVADPSIQGEIGDDTQQGPGRNFNIAGCYEEIVPDVFGFTSVATCPSPP